MHDAQGYKQYLYHVRGKQQSPLSERPTATAGWNVSGVVINLKVCLTL